MFIAFSCVNAPDFVPYIVYGFVFVAILQAHPSAQRLLNSGLRLLDLVAAQDVAQSQSVRSHDVLEKQLQHWKNDFHSGLPPVTIAGDTAASSDRPVGTSPVADDQKSSEAASSTSAAALQNALNVIMPQILGLGNEDAEEDDVAPDELLDMEAEMAAELDAVQPISAPLAPADVLLPPEQPAAAMAAEHGIEVPSVLDELDDAAAEEGDSNDDDDHDDSMADDMDEAEMHSDHEDDDEEAEEAEDSSDHESAVVPPSDSNAGIVLESASASSSSSSASSQSAVAAADSVMLPVSSSSSSSSSSLDVAASSSSAAVSGATVSATAGGAVLPTAAPSTSSSSAVNTVASQTNLTTQAQLLIQRLTAATAVPGSDPDATDESSAVSAAEERSRLFSRRSLLPPSSRSVGQRRSMMSAYQQPPVTETAPSFVRLITNGAAANPAAPQANLLRARDMEVGLSAELGRLTAQLMASQHRSAADVARVHDLTRLMRSNYQSADPSEVLAAVAAGSSSAARLPVHSDAFAW